MQASIQAQAHFAATAQAVTTMAGGLIQDAAMYARQVHAIEMLGSFDRIADPDRSMHRAGAISAIILAASGLEAYANEVFLGAVEHFSPAVRKRIKGSWEDIERLQPLPKLNRALALAGKRQITSGDAKFKECKNALTLRNGFVHFKTRAYPMIAKNKDPHAKVEKMLRGNRFSKKPYYPVAMSPFPFHCFSHACVEWAIKAHLAMLDLFAQQMCIPPLSKHSWVFATR